MSRRKGKGFKTDEQRKAVMAILKGGKTTVRTTPLYSHDGHTSYSVELLNDQYPNAMFAAKALTEKRHAAFSKRLGKRYPDTAGKDPAGQLKVLESMLADEAGRDWRWREFDSPDKAKRRRIRRLRRDYKVAKQYWSDLENYNTYSKWIKGEGRAAKSFDPFRIGRTKLVPGDADFLETMADEALDDNEARSMRADIRNNRTNDESYDVYLFLRDYYRTHTPGLEHNTRLLRGNRIGSALYILGLREAKKKGKKGIVSYRGDRSDEADRVWSRIANRQEKFDDLPIDFGERGFTIDVMDSVRPHARRRGRTLRRKRNKGK